MHYTQRFPLHRHLRVGLPQAFGNPQTSAASAIASTSYYQGRNLVRFQCAAAVAESTGQVDGSLNGTKSTIIKFSCKEKCPFGVGIVVTGSDEALGNWDPAKGLQLEVFICNIIKWSNLKFVFVHNKIKLERVILILLQSRQF